MSVVKVIELIAESDKSWEDATRQCVEEASQTVKNIKSCYLEDMQAIIEGGRIAKYRANCKISFVIDDHMRHPAL